MNCCNHEQTTPYCAWCGKKLAKTAGEELLCFVRNKRDRQKSCAEHARKYEFTNLNEVVDEYNTWQRWADWLEGVLNDQ